ncbi:MAG: hypothetical protein L0Y71_15415 [Gemmataceae bacterium]|nr:hypothetical protein [Gemmataceae bacterium]
MTPPIFASAALAAVLFGADVPVHKPPLMSGPPVGAANNRSGFRPQFVAGPSTGQRLCPV